MIYDLFHISLTLISLTGTYEPTIDLLQRQWLHSSVARASHRYREVTGSNPVEVLNLFQASLRNCINCVHCVNHFFISFPQFTYDLFHISLTILKQLKEWHVIVSCNQSGETLQVASTQPCMEAAHKRTNWAKFNFYVYARPSIHCLNFLFAREIYVRMHVKITWQWKSTSTERTCVAPISKVKRRKWYRISVDNILYQITFRAGTKSYPVLV